MKKYQMKRAKRNVVDELFFEKCDLNKNKLPTKRDVLQYLMFLQHFGCPNKSMYLKLTDYIEEVIKEISDLWQRVNIPLLSRTSIRKRINELVFTYNEILKTPNKYRESEWNELFLISRCKCKIESNEQCNCAAVHKIPQNAKEFYIDQIGPRLLSLENEPEQVDDVNMENQSDITSVQVKPSPQTTGYSPNTSEEEEFESSRRELSPSVESQLKVSNIRLRNYCAALDRSDTSVRFGALLATTLINDIRISIAAMAQKDFAPDIAEKISKFFDDLIIDKNKILRERQKFRIEATEAAKYHGLLKCISFDGKKEETLKKKVAGKDIKVVEEHVTILKEPDSKFIGYATPTEGTGVGIQKSIVNFLIDHDYNMDHLVAISCDGTATNTGYRNGVIAFMERSLNRPLQWLVCLFHFNELPFTALLTNLAGKPKGPGLWQGEIGEGIRNCRKHPVSFVFQQTLSTQKITY